MEAKEIASIIDRINVKTNHYYIEGKGRFSPEDIEMIALHRQFAIFAAGRIEGIKEVVDEIGNALVNAKRGHRIEAVERCLGKWCNKITEIEGNHDKEEERE